MRLYEAENPYRTLGLPRNPFELLVDLEKTYEIAFQREANRVFLAVEPDPKKKVVVMLPEKTPLRDIVIFYSFLFRTFLLAPEQSWFVFDVHGSFVRALGSGAGFQAVKSRIFEGNAPRIFYSYVVDVLQKAHQAGSLKEQLPSFSDLDKFVEEAVATKGEAVGQVLFYQPTLPEKPAEDAPEEEKKAFEARIKEEEEKMNRKNELRLFLRKTIENDNLSPGVKMILKTTVEQGIELGMSSLIPTDAKKDFIGLLKLLEFGYSRVLAFFYGIGDTPLLDEEEEIEYNSTVAELERVVSSFGNVIYLLTPEKAKNIPDLLTGKEEIKLDIFPQFLKEGEQSKEWFKQVALYLAGAFPQMSKELLAEVEEAAPVAYEAAEEDAEYALKLLANAFKRKAEDNSIKLSDVIEA